jgi:hypothetical protein
VFPEIGSEGGSPIPSLWGPDEKGGVHGKEQVLLIVLQGGADVDVDAELGVFLQGMAKMGG